MRRRSRWSRFVPPLALLASLACRPEPVETVGPQTVQAPAEVAPQRPQVDAQAMLASITWLADDERQGRFTLDPQIEEAARWIGDRYQALGLQPAAGASELRVAYGLRTKVEAGTDSRLVVLGPRKPTTVDAAQFIPRAAGISGSAKGEVVFVGYAARWDESQQAALVGNSRRGEGEPEAEPLPLPISSYDDLANVDLSGKIALVLDAAPNQPDLMALFMAMQKLAEDFEASAAPLREAEDLRKLTALHQRARKQLVELVSSFVDTSDLGDDFWKVEDPKASLDIMRLAGSFMDQAAQKPQFDPSENSLAKKLERLAAAGAVGVILVQGPRTFLGKQAREADVLPGVMGPTPSFGSGSGSRVDIIPEPGPLPVVQLRWKQADKLFRAEGKTLSQLQAAIDGDLQPRTQALGLEVELSTVLVEERREVPNVVAVLPGETDELVVLGAHFDHIGNDQSGHCRAVVRKDERDTICNGADDNASGTAMLLELARVYTESGITPKRTLVFAHFSGEELGLLGSGALARQAPFDMDKVVAMVNLDMVGRLGPSGLAIGGIDSSEQWMPLLDELGNYGMKILYEGSTTTRSDHAWWFRRQIPVLFFFTGVHPDYHRAGDELDEINVEGLGSIGQMVSDLVWELAGGYEIRWGKLEPGQGIGRGLPGADPDTVIKKVDKDGTVVQD